MGNLEIRLVAHEEDHILDGFQRDLYTKKQAIEKLSDLIKQHPQLYGFDIYDEVETLDAKESKKAAIERINHHIEINRPKKYKQININIETFKKLKILSVELDKTLAGTITYLFNEYKRRQNEYFTGGWQK